MIALQRRALIVVGCLIDLIALHLTYVLILNPFYEPRGFAYHPPKLVALLLACISVLLPALWLPVRLHRPSVVVYWLLYVFVLVPALLIPLYSLDLDSTQLLAQNATLVAAFALLCSGYILPLPQIRRFRISPRLFWLGIGAGSMLLGTYVITTFGLRFSVVGLLDVYEVRGAYHESANEAGGPIIYAVSWLGYVILPFLIIQAFFIRSWVLLTIAVLSELELYAITGIKSLLFLIPLAGAIYFAGWKRGRNFGPAVIWGAATLALGSLLAALISGEPLIAYYAIGRPVAVPGLLTGFYFDFFAVHEQAGLRHSILSFLGGYPYNVTPAFVIGADYLGNPNTSVNANFLADGFANFGYAGIFAAAAILASLLYLLDTIAARISDPRPALLLSISAFTLANSGLLTSLLTHGLALTILIIYFMPPLTAPALNRQALRSDEPRKRLIRAQL